MSVNFACAVFSALDFLTFVAGPIRCPATSVKNYHSALCNVPEQSTSHMTIWWCRPWFGSKHSNLAPSCSVLHTWTEDDLTNLSAKFPGEKNPSCIWVNMVDSLQLPYYSHSAICCCYYYYYRYLLFRCFQQCCCCCCCCCFVVVSCTPLFHLGGRFSRT
jgi:hypothetical protein